MFLLPALAGGVAGAEPKEITSVLVSRTADAAYVEIRFACPNRFLGQSPLTAAARTEITLARLDQCTGPGHDIREATRPAGGSLAALEEIEYSMRGGAEATLRLRFDRPVLVMAEQSGDPRGLSLRVQVPAGSEPTATAPEPPGTKAPPAARAALSPEQLARAEERARLAIQPKPARVPAPADFVLNLKSSTQPIDLGVESAGLAQHSGVVYVADINVDGQEWHRLRLGFFATEAAADAALVMLRPRVPDAWVTRVSAAERLAARADTDGALRDGAQATAAGGSGTLSDTQVQGILADARNAIIDREYSRAAELATRILAVTPRAETAEARELLGLARERNGQVAQAVAEYRRYLADYSGTEGAVRVGQRLAALTTARERPRASIRAGDSAARDSDWEIYGGISQYYHLDSVDFGGDSSVVDQSAVFSDAELVVRHSGARFDFGSRATLGYDYDMSGGESAYDSQSHFYNLYADLSDRNLGLFARLGRQTLRNQGVFGRFDGALVSWQWAPSYRLNLLAGYPVYSSDESIDTSRKFFGYSVDVLGLLDMFDVNMFVNVQEVDGVSDRQAVGTEVRYLGENRSLIASVEYDFAYSELTSLAALGNWTFDNRVTANARFDWRKAPFLTTEAALIGQPESSIQELLLTYAEAEIRQLALDRAGSMQSIAVGVARPLSERFEISADVTASQYDGTPESGGVRETEDSGTLVYSCLSLIGSSLIREGDLAILGLRYADGGTAKSTAIFLDARYPLTRNLRLNPKLFLSRVQLTQGDSTDLLIRPGLRLQYRLARHYQFEVEGGGEFGSHDNALGTNDSTGYYFYAGYRADF